MKVCQLCAIDFTLKNFLIPLIDGMVDEGWDVYSVCSNGDFITELQKQGYNITNIEISRSINPFKHLITVYKLFNFFRKEKFDNSLKKILGEFISTDFDDILAGVERDCDKRLELFMGW